MAHGHEPDRPAARRARRLVRWRAGDPARAAAQDARELVGGSAAATDTWFDAWLAGDEDAVVLDPPDGWTTLHDLHRPGSASRTLDCLAVGPGGVVVIQSLRWDGPTTVVDGTLRHRGYGRTPDVASAADTAGAVTALLAPTHRRAVRAVVSLAGQDLEPSTVRGGAVAVGERRLPDWLASLPPVLAPADVRLVLDYLAAELTGPTSPELLTVDDVFRPDEVWAAPDVPAQRPWDPSEPPVAGPDGEPAVPWGPVGGSDGTHRGEGWGATGAAREPGNHIDDGRTPDGRGERADDGADRGAGNALGDHRGPGRDAPAPLDAARGATARGARGDGALRVGMLVLGLLTAGNILLAWLDAAG